jgi:stearoyl-CoA desaturase (delta-9 desaturase)
VIAERRADVTADFAARRRVRTKGNASGLGLLVLHLGALAAFVPGTFAWSALAIGVALHYVTGGIGISLGFHRTLTHRSLQCPRWLEYLFAVCGTLALQGGPLEWIATHRAHHAHTDREGDPHNVHRGLGWAHIAWLYRNNDARPTEAEQHRLAPDIAGVPFYRFLERTYLLWQVALGLLLFAVGGWPFVIWGIFVRVVVTYHVTWFVNSAAHRSGYRTFRTGDESTNNWWVALLTWGEGWHNNHHAFPFSARHGLRRSEIDVTWCSIRLLAMLRLAHNIKLPTAAMIDRLGVRKEPLRP